MTRRTRLGVFSVGIGLVAILLTEVTAAQQRSPNLPVGTGTISGRVVAGDTGKPLRGALVEIVIYAAPSGQALSSRFAQALADDQGRFAFDKLPPGRFELAAQATAYIRQQYGQQVPGPVGLYNPSRSVMVDDGQAVTGIDFTLTHFSAIEGTLTDEFGDPVPNVLVQASQVTFVGGQHRLLPANPALAAGPAQPTDDRGHYRISGLAPGAYYVQALSGAFADPSAAGGFAITYFPGTTDGTSARPVTLAPGRDALDTSFPLAPAPSTPVAGIVVDDKDQPVGGANLLLLPAGANGLTMFALVRGVADPRGQFTFRNVPPGTYTIQAFGPPINRGVGNLNGGAFGYITFRAGPESARLVLRIPAPRSLRGHVTFEGDPGLPRPHPQQVQVLTNIIDFDSAPVAGGPAPFAVHDDWTFEVQALSGLRTVRAAAPGWFLKSVMVDGQDVADTPVDLREHDVNGAEIVLTTVATTVTATLTDLPKGQAPTDYNVLIFGAQDSTWTTLSRYVVLIRPNQQGAFIARALPPGPYYAVVVGALTQGEWQDPEFLRTILARGAATALSLSEGQSQAITLAIPK